MDPASKYLRRQLERINRRPDRLPEDFLLIDVPGVRPAPEDAVRWLLAFRDIDLPALSEAEIQVVAVRTFALLGADGRGIPGARAMLLEWQTALKDHVKRYFDGSGWPFDVPLCGRAYRTVRGVTMSTEPVRVNRQGFLWAALQSIAHLGKRFRQCENPQCCRDFVAQRKQRFCTLACGGKVRMARFRQALDQDTARKAEHVKRRRKRRHARYEKTQQAKHGRQKIRVATRRER